MREIKFRAWSKTHKKMFFEDTFKCALAGMINIAKIYLGRCDIKGGIYLPVDDTKLIFMQYTGIKDKNDKEIYEGDIVRYISKTVDELTRIVTFKDGAFGIEGWYQGTHIIFGNILDNQIEVIGNIYENPELIEVKND